MEPDNDVIVFDEEYFFAASELRQYANALDDLISQYVSTVKVITERAISDEKISSRLVNIMEQAEALRPQLKETVEKAADMCTKFVAEIDSADKFLY